MYKLNYSWTQRIFSAINALELSISYFSVTNTLRKMLIKEVNAKLSKKKGELRTERERIILTYQEIPQVNNLIGFSSKYFRVMIGMQFQRFDWLSD